jgi:hypothetical protein
MVREASATERPRRRLIGPRLDNVLTAELIERIDGLIAEKRALSAAVPGPGLNGLQYGGGDSQRNGEHGRRHVGDTVGRAHVEDDGSH